MTTGDGPDASSLSLDPPGAGASRRVFAALDQAPMTWRHYALWFAASGGALIDGWTVATLGLALPLLKSVFALDATFVGLLGSALLVGAVISAWVGGVLADKYGRRRVLIIDMAIIAAAGLIGALAREPWMLLLSEFVAGLGIGADFPTSAAYVSELMPRKARSRMTVATIAMQAVGMICAVLVGLAILRLDPAQGAWRLMFGAQAAVAICFFLGRLAAPDSVRWLAIKGRLTEARALLARLAREFDDTALLSTPLEATSAAALATPAAPKASVAMLFGRRFRDRTLLACVPWTLMDVATYGVGLFTPVILGALHFDAANANVVIADTSDAEGSALVDVFLLLGFAASLWAVPKFGRVPMQVAGFGGMAVGMALLLFATLTGEGAAHHLVLVLGGFILFNFAMNIGPNATTFALPPTLFPTAVRASASGFAAGCAKIGATFGAFVVPLLQARWGLSGVLALMTLVSLLGLVVTAGLAHAVNEEGAIEE
jgi:MFS transporter, putative metabolite transport protein